MPMSDLVLTRVQYMLLSVALHDEEPLHVLYCDIMREVKGATLEAILEALVQLVNAGLMTCHYLNYKTHTRDARKTLTLQELAQHCAGRTPRDLAKYPVRGGEYEFRTTQKGELEVCKDVYYDAYHVEGR